jgi:hypothetical protein
MSDPHATIEQLRRALSEAQARADQERREKEEEKRRNVQLQGQLHEAQRRLEKATFEEFLRDCHHIFQSLKIAPREASSTGHGTKVDGRRYPAWLRPWSEFTELHRGLYDSVQRIFGEKRLFPESISAGRVRRLATRRPAAYEKDIDKFENAAVEDPVEEILEALLQVDPGAADKFHFAGMRFCNTDRGLKQPDDTEVGNDEAARDEADQAQRTKQQPKPSKRAATESNVDSPTYPDGLGFRTSPKRGDMDRENLAFCFDYKAAHKLLAKDLKNALVKEKLFMEVVRRVNSGKMTDNDTKEREHAEKRIAMALTQVFNYMLVRGTAYGYVTAGRALVLLHVNLKDPQTLYYHLCAPDVDVDTQGVDNLGLMVYQTAVAQMLSFCLLSFQSEPIQGHLLEELNRTVELKRWPYPYDEAECTDSSQSAPASQETKESDSLYEEETQAALVTRTHPTRARAGTCRNIEAVRRRNNEDDDDDANDTSRRAPARGVGTASSAMKRKGRPSSGSSQGGSERGSSSSESERQPTRQYCTQACLLGLKRGWEIDDNCPNASSHRAAAATAEVDGDRHAISAAEFTALVDKQLACNVYWDCAPVDPYGQGGKIGAIGALFKLELAPYGYTFVAKGTQSAHRRHLMHEGLVYDRLERLQGEVVPVYLGLVDVGDPRGYALPGGARVFHMMLMSWCGEIAVDCEVPDLQAHRRRSTGDVWREGVCQDDVRELNLLWNEERRRVMVIDFDRATFLQPAQHKRVSLLSEPGAKKKKRKQQTDIYKRDGAKRRTGSGLQSKV